MNVRPISRTSVGARGRGGSRRLLALVSGVLVLAVTACGGNAADGTAGDGKGKDSGTVRSKQSQAVVTIAPEDGAKSVDTSGTLKVGVSKGKLTRVVVKDPKGTTVPGEMSGDGTSWTPSRHLATATTYTVHAVAKDSSGVETTKKSSFTTLTPQNTFVGHFTPEDGSTVGVGMPFSLRFTRGITKPEAVEKAIEIKTDPPVEVAGHWFGNDRLDFRPEHYWKAGTKVTVKLDLDGVEGRPGVYGKQARTVSFTIGRNQVSVVDAKTHTMKVMREGKVIRTIPITAGAPSTPTWNGQMVISEKLKVTRMNGATVGFVNSDGTSEYDIPDVPHAIRLTTSGTFLHGNYWSGNAFGNYNASHGCIGLRDVRGGYDKNTPAAWFYNQSMVGDVVIVKNSRDRTVAPDNGFNGWNMSWEEWKS